MYQEQGPGLLKGIALSTRLRLLGKGGYSDIYSYLSNRNFYEFKYRRGKPTRDVGRTREKLVNHKPAAIILSSLIFFLLF